MRVFASLSALLVMAGAAGCGYHVPEAPPAPRRMSNGNEVGQTTVGVHNQSSVDVDVFMWDGWDRATRLGFLGAGDSALFTLPETILAASGPYSLEARAVQGSEYPGYSDPFSMGVGDRINWSIPADNAVGDNAGDDAVGAAPQDVPAPMGVTSNTGPDTSSN